MLADHQEYDVVVTAVTRAGIAFHADGHGGFIDWIRHPSWRSNTPRAAVGDRTHAVVLDATRTPPRFNALPSDIRTARSLHHTKPLTRLCPPPSHGRTVDRATAEESLGTALPADYKRLVEQYDGRLFVGIHWLLEPGCPDALYDLVAQTAEHEEILTKLWEASEDKPSELHENDVRLVPWGYVEGAGHFLYWLVRPDAEPEEWTVLLNEGRDPLWEAHPMSCSQFLLEVVAGTTTSFYFTGINDIVDPEDRTRFIPNSQILKR
ncbi:SMI1/KNR4 family protein [Streptomyces sp. F-3]|uniref:SMI1/KNR4 family protein n=1 Tax=Streptomyces sp. F-3 TaxID=1840095 RepID=UPI000AEAE526|nr:SMI1/KNR4 family protein [Streptomyces sp. F-3]